MISRPMQQSLLRCHVGVQGNMTAVPERVQCIGTTLAHLAGAPGGRAQAQSGLQNNCKIIEAFLKEYTGITCGRRERADTTSILPRTA